MMATNSALRPYLDALRALPFVQELQFSKPPAEKDLGVDGILTLRTPQRTYVFSVQQKRSYFDSSLLHAVIAQAKANLSQHRHPLFLFARYLPTPSAERLIESGINFIDQTGNIHVNLGKEYERTIIGKKERAAKAQTHRLTPATVQILFSFAADNNAPNWSVRHLAEVAGLSKSNVAKLRQQLIDKGTLRQTDKRVELPGIKELEDELLQGYELALRPKLYIGRFRGPDNDLDTILTKAREAFAELSVHWSMTGGPAANALQHFYRGPELPLFVEPFSDSLRRRLRLLPDKTGPLIFLRPFGKLPFWQEAEGFPVAHPWLIYAELMNSDDPRAHEAAQEIKDQYLIIPTNA
jgi:hypothetical protein